MNIRKLFIAVSNKHDLYYRIVLITFAILIITAFLPQKIRFKYEFKQGSVWHYDDLKAPFDFPIIKSSKEIDHEKEVIRNESILILNNDTLAVNRALLDFEAIYKGGNSKESITAISIIRVIYEQGIVELPRNFVSSLNQELWIVRGHSKSPTVSSAHIQTNQLAAVVENYLVKNGMQANTNLLSAIVEASKPNLVYDDHLTELFRKERIDNIVSSRGLIPQGTTIIERGRIIGPREFEILNSLKLSFRGDEAEIRASRPWLYTGYLMLVFTATMVLIAFLWLLRKDIILDSRKISLLFLMIVFTCIIFSFFCDSTRLNSMMVPLCILPLVVRAFFDTRTALFTHVLTILILGTIAPDGFDFVFMQIIAGMVSIFSIVNMRKRSQLFIAVGLIFVAYFICYLGLSILDEGSIVKVNYSNTVWLLGNCLLTLLSYPLIFFIEKTFGVTSDFTLMELTDFNSELLRELAIKAPGTFQHSMQVANLAESAIYRIGGNSLLVRVGALYHDIGKMEMPMYFIENQTTQVNPHDELSFEESASIIISHVKRGIELSRKYKLPDMIIDFIRTHHGTMVVQYFYQSFIKSFPEEIADEADFRYPGPKPFSKETAVLMMADSVEASARSLEVHDASSIDKLVEKIINHQIECGQFENCDITYRDITAIKKIFKKMLSSIYHVRIAYPSSN